MDKLSTNGSMIEQLDLSGVPHSGFDMSFHNYLTGRLGALIPTAVKEVLPGDRLKGDDLIVTQFEPLAAPILGNMIQKAETFFVPYSVIWDKSHRFFTGKKGFNDEMPQKSLAEIYGLLKLAGLMPDLSTCFKLVEIENENKHVFDVGDFDEYVTNIKATDYYSEQGLQDLFKPLFASFDNSIQVLSPLTNSDNEIVLDGSLTNIDAVANALAGIYNFWFGISSMIDYMGVGCISQFDTLFKLLISNYVTSEHDVDTKFSAWWTDYHNIKFNWLPFRAAYWVWYWNYRDQLIETEVIDPEEDMYSSTVNVSEILACLLVRQRCWMKDTFTTALTNTGDGNVVVPVSDYSFDVVVHNGSDLSDTSDAAAVGDTYRELTSISIGGITYDIPSLYLNSLSSTDTAESNLNGVSLNLLDRARRLSSWLSKRLVLGTEYDDVVYSSFMVKLNNVRMRIPELLCTSRSTVAITPIVNNTDIPDGQVAGSKTAIAYANNADNTGNINYFAEEHGLIISYMSVMPIQSYPNQVQRLWFKKNRFDFAWPEFAQLGMDAVYLSELNGQISLNPDTALSVFGYQGRYYDYKCNQDEEHGRLHTDLNYLTFGRSWSVDELPKLNSEFVHCWPRTDMFVVDDGVSDLFRSDVYHRWAMERRLPVPSDVLR